MESISTPKVSSAYLLEIHMQSLMITPSLCLLTLLIFWNLSEEQKQEQILWRTDNWEVRGAIFGWKRLKGSSSNSLRQATKLSMPNSQRILLKSFVICCVFHRENTLKKKQNKTNDNKK